MGMTAQETAMSTQKSMYEGLISEKKKHSTQSQASKSTHDAAVTELNNIISALNTKISALEASQRKESDIQAIKSLGEAITTCNKNVTTETAKKTTLDASIAELEKYKAGI